jgi:hypothetical protein
MVFIFNNLGGMAEANEVQYVQDRLLVQFFPGLRAEQ